ncbi:hypothetical protein RCH23_001687 [Cryobacterium sp. CAN_C3]|nr:hypothetical protein [Cryobacterium sp. CAN_C3]
MSKRGSVVRAYRSTSTTAEGWLNEDHAEAAEPGIK